MALMIYSPLEQFEIVALGPIIKIGDYWIAFTNAAIIMIFGLGLLIYLVYWQILGNRYFIPTRYQYIIEGIYRGLYNMVNIGSEASFPLVFAVCFFLFVCNCVGMVPYSFTVTSHIIITFVLAFAVFVAVNLIAISKHGYRTLQLFLPPGSTFALSPILIPIELISYTFRLISLSVRLFANMLAGHVLLKTIIGFAWVALSGIGAWIIYPLGFILVGFEFGVALIQTYVFTILVCIYLSDAYNLH